MASQELETVTQNASSVRLNSNQAAVAAIDFGTTYSGYAFSFRSNKKEIRMFTRWGADVGITHTYKTPSVVLTKSCGSSNEFVAFGYEALMKYSDIDEEEIGNYSIYDKFKMHLHKAKKLGHTSYIEAKKGVPAKAITIFAYGLRYLSQHMLDLAETQTGMKLSYDQVQWVVTVPAIWSDGAKQFMREAAYKAGLITEQISTSLSIALEPEAAAIHCQHIDMDIKTARKTQHGKMPVGTHYLVLDCGGGTLDVTVHELKANNKISELYQATGSDHGGMRVDNNFTQLLKDVFGEDVMDHYMSESPADWLHMLSAFEQKKKAVSPSTIKRTSITISAEFGNKYSEVTTNPIKKAISEEWKGRGIAISGGLLHLSHPIMLGLFKPVVDGIVSHVKNLLPKVPTVTHMLVVGGFGECTVLQDALRKEFSKKLTIVVPESASNSVMQGAVHFGHFPSAVISRKSQRTYGTDVYPIFDPAKHDPSKTKEYGKVRRAEGLFRTWIKLGAEVRTDRPLKFVHVPVNPEQANMSIGIYCSDHPSPEYCNEKHVEHLGHITVDLPGVGLDRRVEVMIIFGGTEITVQGRDLRPGGKSTSTRVNFLAD